MLLTNRPRACSCLAAIFIYCVGAIYLIANAQPASTNPILFAEADGAADARLYLEMAELRIEVTLDGSIVETTMTARFRGPPENTLEGHFQLALPEGAAVSGYALDIEDRLIEGVLAKSKKAQSAYDDIVRAGIDPGIGKVSEANIFATQVYPIPEESGRTVRVRFAAPMLPRKGFQLPLRTESRISRVAISIKARGIAEAPRVQLPFEGPVEWHTTQEGFEASLAADDVALKGSLSFAPAALSSAISVSTHSSGERFFQIADSADLLVRDESAPHAVRVYWDASRSRKDDALEQEKQLLARYLSSMPGAQVDLIVFNSRAIQSDWVVHSDIAKVLDAITYRGGTSFADLASIQSASAPVCLLFSDGIATFDTRDTFKPACVVHAITSAADADIGYLNRLARETGGTWNRLAMDNVKAVFERLRFGIAQAVEVMDDAGNPLPFAALPSGQNDWLIVGKAPSHGSITLRLANVASGSAQRRYALPETQTTFDAVGSLWALNRILELNTRPEKASELLAFSQRYRVASTAASFVVLEDPYDYARTGFEPPSDYTPEQKEEYAEYKAEIEAEQAEVAASRLSSVLETWEEHKDWWQTKFNPYQRRPTKRRRGRGDLEEVLVTGLRGSLIMGPTIMLEERDLGRPYLKALDASPGDGIKQTLLEQEQLHGVVPAFYLDTAEWLHRHGRALLALELLESTLELPSANDETLAITADRLLRYGSIDRAIGLYERMLYVADDRPQPRLALAMALAMRAGNSDSDSARHDLQRAVSLLNEIVMTPWEGDYDGIEIIALTEANAIIPRLRDLGATDVVLDSRLIAVLDVDIRVVVQWNTAATDIDLWIDEPNGERAIFHNPLTAAGGRLSNDMTSGYGPEQYMLRRSRRGNYNIRLDVYAGDPLNPNGATWVTVRIYKDFGRRNQREEVIEIELESEQEGEILVGKIRGGR